MPGIDFGVPVAFRTEIAKALASAPQVGPNAQGVRLREELSDVVEATCKHAAEVLDIDLEESERTLLRLGKYLLETPEFAGAGDQRRRPTSLPFAG